jgi:hypothetical protein
MREESHDWTQDVEEFVNLPIGETTFEIVGDASCIEGDYGKRLHIPTNLGPWRISANSPVARELKKVKLKIGTINHVSLTIVRTGEKMDTRYSIKKIVLPQQRRHEVPPANQGMLNLENLTDQQKQQLQHLLQRDRETQQATA